MVIFSLFFLIFSKNINKIIIILCKNIIIIIQNKNIIILIINIIIFIIKNLIILIINNIIFIKNLISNNIINFFFKGRKPIIRFEKLLKPFPEIVMRILKNVVRSLKNFVELFQMSLDHKQLNFI